MKNSAKLIFLICLFTGLTGFQQSSDLPTGWFKAGSQPDKYEMGLDDKTVLEGKYAAFIESKEGAIEGFGTLMQTCSAKKFLGKKIRMTGHIKSKNVEGWAGLWLRIDRDKDQPPLAFDNMHNRAIKGTTDWKEYEIILEVPTTSSTLNFGALLGGTGKIWFDNLSFEVIGKTTQQKQENNMLPEPTNTDFEK